ncbi:RNA-binding protein 4.1-like isoform X2 [Pomacea canaliculata]|uniref:RNA-binding protein 4.1-like isoform X2 n=1 Tax=Pomacea canaliculata TaxID=400727 RepID=UPI000D73212F|nr:RNA-binding protein 4.1-like isoform X2 [Pomacea canaliculata]
MNKLPSRKVYVGNLPDNCDKENLQKLFESVGKIAEFDVVKNFGFVHFETEEGAKRAVDELNDTEFEGMVIKVELSRSKVRHKPGMGDMTECYRCGKDGHWSKDCPKAGRGRGRGRGGPPRPAEPYGPPAFRDPYADPYADPYLRNRYFPSGYDRYHPYGDPYDRRPAPYRDPYYERDPYARPSVDYYDRLAARDPYYDYYARRSYLPPPRPDSPSRRGRMPGPF